MEFKKEIKFSIPEGASNYLAESTSTYNEGNCNYTSKLTIQINMIPSNKKGAAKKGGPFENGDKGNRKLSQNAAKSNKRNVKTVKSQKRPLKSSVFIDSSDDEESSIPLVSSPLQKKTKTATDSKSKSPLNRYTMDTFLNRRKQNKPSTSSKVKTASSTVTRNKKTIYSLSDSDDEIKTDVNKVQQPELPEDPYLKRIINKYSDAKVTGEKKEVTPILYDLSQPSTSSLSNHFEVPITTTVPAKKTVREEDVMEYINSVLEQDEEPLMSDTELNELSNRLNQPDQSVIILDSFNSADNSVIDLSTISSPKPITGEIIDLSTSFNTPDTNKPQISNEGVAPKEDITSNLVKAGQPTPQKQLPECPVCMESLTGKQVMATICGHIFCKPCIETSIKHIKKCPNCRKPLSKTKILPLYL